MKGILASLTALTLIWWGPVEGIPWVENLAAFGLRVYPVFWAAFSALVLFGFLISSTKDQAKAGEALREGRGRKLTGRVRRLLYVLVVGALAAIGWFWTALLWVLLLSWVRLTLKLIEIGAEQAAKELAGEAEA